jgi:TolB-like protein
MAHVKSIMILAIIIIIASLALVPQRSFSQTEKLTVAVLDFKDNSPLASEELKPLQQGLADVLITAFSEVEAFKIVERSKLSELLEEMALGQSGAIDEASAQKVGNLVGAQYIVLGSFMKGFKNDIRIDCRIVRIETGVLLKAEEVSGKIKDILDLMSKIGEKVVHDLDVKLNPQQREAIKRLNRACSYDVMMDYFKALNLMKAKNYRDADALLTKVIEECPEFRRAKIVQLELRASLRKKLKGS